MYLTSSLSLIGQPLERKRSSRAFPSGPTRQESPKKVKIAPRKTAFRDLLTGPLLNRLVPSSVSPGYMRSDPVLATLTLRQKMPTRSKRCLSVVDSNTSTTGLGAAALPFPPLKRSARRRTPTAKAVMGHMTHSKTVGTEDVAQLSASTEKSATRVEPVSAQQLNADNTSVHSSFAMALHSMIVPPETSCTTASTGSTDDSKLQSKTCTVPMTVAYAEPIDVSIIANQVSDGNLLSSDSISDFLDSLDNQCCPAPSAAAMTAIAMSNNTSIQRIGSYAAFEGLDVHPGTDSRSVDGGSDTDVSCTVDTETLNVPHGKLVSAAARKEQNPNRKEWTEWEDETIRQGVQTVGTRWRQIAEALPGRSDDAVRNRWARLHQSLCGLKGSPSPRVKRDGGEQRQSWTEEEDTIIIESVRQFGHRWNRIAERLPRRTEHAIRNRWHRIQMRELEERSIVAAAPVGPAHPAAIATVPVNAVSSYGSETKSAAVKTDPAASLPVALPGRVTAPSSLLSRDDAVVAYASTTTVSAVQLGADLPRAAPVNTSTRCSSFELDEADTLNMEHYMFTPADLELSDLS